jgi:hypothetical protein
MKEGLKPGIRMNDCQLPFCYPGIVIKQVRRLLLWLVFSVGSRPGLDSQVEEKRFAPLQTTYNIIPIRLSSERKSERCVNCGSSES